ncbi:hypothetical protein [Telluribacter humicola]|uniref:hypothetical protein n=1 Tax=Telluribacter humicola TaxID=1720261 RepID=UPI001A9587D4|nr:hypothetical protein [Telluribacter humicola]
MAQCNISINFNEPIDQLVEKAEDGITSIGGAFIGNTNSGEYSIPTPVGNIMGNYTVTDRLINFEISKKPLLVTCKKIEDELRKFIGSTSTNSLSFSISNVGALTIRRPISMSSLELVSSAETRTSQLVTATVTLYIEDDEAWGSNETWRGTKTNSVTLSTTHLPQQFMEFVVKMGGEIRIELYLTAQIVNPNGDVIVDGEFKMFEGTSEDNNDLDGQRTFQVLANSNSQSSYTSRVNNDDEGGDFAIAQITISNSQLTIA